MSTTEGNSQPSGAGQSAAELLGGEVREATPTLATNDCITSRPVTGR
jgi:hypothetical protein